MPVSKREGSPFFQYSFNLNGRRFRGSTGKTTKREAEEVERDVYQLAKSSLRRQEDWTLQMVLSTYWNEHAKDTRSFYHIEGTFAALQRVIGKSKKTSALTNGDLMDYRAKRRGETRNGRSPRANTINRDFAYLRAAYEHCHRFHKQPLPDIAWKDLKAAEPPWRKRYLGKDEFKRLMGVTPQSVREIVICAIATGLRKANILQMDWSQVSLAERAITVRTKGNKEHVVRISPALLAVLSTKQDRRGKVFDTRNFRKLWEKALEDAAIENFRFHDLRHTFASWGRQEGIDLETLKVALNHSTIAMTMRYAHVEPEEVQTAFDKVSAKLLDTISDAVSEKRAEK